MTDNFDGPTPGSRPATDGAPPFRRGDNLVVIDVVVKQLVLVGFRHLNGSSTKSSDACDYASGARAIVQSAACRATVASRSGRG